MAQKLPSRPARAAAAPGRALPDLINLKRPDGSLQEVPLNQISDPSIAAEMEAFRSDNTGLVVKGLIIKEVKS